MYLRKQVNKDNNNNDKIMKIGILTFHSAHNYGAVLQCYALQEVLKEMGHTVEVIDYRPKYITNVYELFRYDYLMHCEPVSFLKSGMKEFLKMLISPFRYKGYKAFERFIYDKLSLSNRLNVIPAYYDAYVMGSDQIWNRLLTGGDFDPYYFGRFPFAKGNRIYISYAASMETAGQNDKIKEQLAILLQNFDGISVREDQLRDYIATITGKKVNFNIDPTLLAKREIWEKLCVNPNKSKRYILIYEVRFNPALRKIAERIAQKNGLEVLEISTIAQKVFNRGVLSNASPEEFIGLFRYASCVVTSSFHGTAFSIIFNRPFYTFSLDDGFGSRTTSILKLLGLTHCIVNDTSHIDSIPSIDFEKVNMRLEVLRKDSTNYLEYELGKNKFQNYSR